MPICYKDYPLDWEERRARILVRAGHCCEHCHAPNHEFVFRLKAGLTNLFTA